MEYSYCKECGREISSQAAVCIYCGRPKYAELLCVKPIDMKTKIILGSGIIVLSIFLGVVGYLGFGILLFLLGFYFIF